MYVVDILQKSGLGSFYIINDILVRFCTWCTSSFMVHFFIFVQKHLCVEDILNTFFVWGTYSSKVRSSVNLLYLADFTYLYYFHVVQILYLHLVNLLQN